MTTPVCWVESDARVSYANDAFCRDVGYSREETLGKYVYDFSPDFSEEGWSDHWQSIHQQGSGTFESRIWNRKGVCHPVEVTINHIMFHEQEYHLTFIVNISDRKRAESAVLQKSQELEHALQALQHAQLQIIQSEKMSALGNLVAGVAHEINNPVGFIAGNLQPALDYVKDTFGLLDLYQQEYPHPSTAIQDEIEAIDLDYIRQDLPKLIGSMKLGVNRIRGISTSLRTFSRDDKDCKVYFNIHEGIDSTILILKHRLKADSDRPAIEVDTNYGNIPIIECFPGQLNQVFMNILANAIDTLEEATQKLTFENLAANPNRIEIQTRLDESGKQVIIHISDNGMGMTDEVKQRVFDHLFTTKAVGKGTGLGLAIAHQIVVEKHGGEIEVNSTLGMGTEFVTTLPVMAKGYGGRQSG
jgi:PAS domain S-box-containing protein